MYFSRRESFGNVAKAVNLSTVKSHIKETVFVLLALQFVNDISGLE